MNWSIWNPAVVLRRSVIEGKSQIDAVVQLEQEGKGKRDMDAMRALLAEIKGGELILLEQRSKAAVAMSRHETELQISPSFRPPAPDGFLFLRTWAQHVITFHDDAASFIVDAAIIFKLHLFMGMRCS